VGEKEPSQDRGVIDVDGSARFATESVAVGLVDTETAVVIAANGAYARLLGHGPESIAGLPVEAYLAAERAAVSRTVLAGMRDGWVDSLEGETEVQRPSGRLTVYSWSRALGLHPPRQAIIAGAVPMVRRTDGELHAPAVDPDRIILGTLDREGRFHDLAANSASPLGWLDEGNDRARLHEIVHPADRGALASALDPAAVERRPVTVDLRLWQPDDCWTAARVTVSRLYGPAAVPFAVVIGFAGSGRRAETAVKMAGSDVPFVDLTELTRRQNEIVRRVVEGQRVAAIAEDLFLSPSTVRNHLSAVFARFGVHSQSELLALLRHRDMAPS
jgi:DNA-binding CsgD family transcriptional regulator